jgi:tRNA nucleotidyltransferase/poly(A) polymerase
LVNIIKQLHNRNALVFEGQRDQIEAKAEFDIAQFQKNFRKIEGETRVALATSGVELGTGTAYNIELSNAYEAKLQENLIRYNSQKLLQQIKWKKQTLQELEVQWLDKKLRLAQINTVASTGSNIYSRDE